MDTSIQKTPSSVTFQHGSATITLETGRVAKQATSAVYASSGDARVLATVVAKKEARPNQPFFPLGVHFQEPVAAGGRIPGSYFRREGRPGEREILVSRMIDRPIRPLFAKTFQNEVQCVCQVLSADPDRDTHVLGMIATMAAVTIANLPFSGPVASTKVAMNDGKFVYNPTLAELEDSDLEMVVSATKDAVLMVEAGASEISESVMLDAILGAYKELQPVLDAISELKESAGLPAWEAPAEVDTSDIDAFVSSTFGDDVTAAYDITEKQQRQSAIDAIKQRAYDALAEKPDLAGSDVSGAVKRFEKHLVRARILDGKPRIDGRDTTTVRNIACDVGTLPSTHGSAMFTRGETQAIVTASLGTSRDAQKVETVRGHMDDRFMLHYNFPPFSTGETGMIGAPKRREIGHGWLARRAVEQQLPSFDEFPYAIRVVSLITESNGSSSMATVCGATLSLQDAGVPLKRPVAGIAMGLVQEGDQYAVLTDILGDEDHLGDMDFKVAGTPEGITALQMDLKIHGVDRALLETALSQARDARMHILGRMSETLGAPRDEISPKAPSFGEVRVPTDKIRVVIGSGGSTIKALQEETQSTIEIGDDGVVRVFAVSKEARDMAIAKIEALTAEIEPGQDYTGKVVRIVEFGAFVNLIPGKDGLLHISQISATRVNRVDDVLSEGQEVKVRVLDVDDRGRVSLSMKALLPGASSEQPRGDRRDRGHSGDRGNDRRGDAGRGDSERRYRRRS